MGGAARIRHPSELRAIPNNAILQQIGWCANTLQGIGAVLVPHLLVAGDLKRGALLRLLPSLKAHVGVVHAVFPSRRGMVPAVRALLDFLSAEFKVSLSEEITP